MYACQCQRPGIVHAGLQAHLSGTEPVILLVTVHLCLSWYDNSNCCVRKADSLLNDRWKMFSFNSGDLICKPQLMLRFILLELNFKEIVKLS